MPTFERLNEQQQQDLLNFLRSLWGVQARNGVDTLTIPECGVTSSPSGAPEERGGGAAAEAVPLVRPLVIVGLHERLETALQGCATGEVAAAKGHAPMFLQDRALEPFDETVGPGIPRP